MLGSILFRRHISSNSLNALFGRRSVADISPILTTFPIRHPSLPARTRRPGPLQVLKDNYLLYNSVQRAQKALRHPVYNFPGDCQTDCALTWRRFVDNVRARDQHALAQMCMPGLLSEFDHAWSGLDRENISIDVHLSPDTDVSATLKHVALVYGPFPVPENYDVQHWFSSIQLIVPADEVDFVDHRKQLETYQKALAAGQYMRLGMEIEGNLIVTIKRDGVVLSTAERRSLDVEFVSPHFRADEEIMEFVPLQHQNSSPDEVRGNWKLRWEWRVSDIDHVIASRRSEKMGPRIRLRDFSKQ